MRPAGLVCKIDKLGRIVIPKPLRKEFEIDTGDTIEFFTGNRDDLTEYQGKPVCAECIDKLKTL